MITFLWMLYLAVTLISSILTILFTLHADKLDNEDARSVLKLIIITSTMWSIWYMYYLN